MIINDLDGYYIVFDTKNWNTELDTLIKWSKWQQLKIALLIAYLKRRMKLKRKLIRNNRQRPSATSASFVSIK